MRQFDFGQNWSDFSANALTAERVKQARDDFAQLTGMAGVELRGASFVDIGFGQGLGLLSAASIVRPGGSLVMALYNRHWTSPAWAVIERAYVLAPRILQKAMIAAIYPVIFAAKWAVTSAPTTVH